ncbi:DUF1751-domain-containing protein [Clavulina sp. PMI_390]|nr:DUF1751-domain-containing protein [Clavulina sp. PMI_390]
MAILNSPIQFITSIPPAARGFTIALVVLSLGRILLSQLFPESPFILELVPGLLLWRPWTLVTSSFVEVGLIELAVSLVVLPISLQYVERLWGAIETVKFVLVTCVVSNVIAVIVNIVEHFLIGMDGFFLFTMNYHGMMALQVGMLVALTQQIPEHQVLLFGMYGVRVKRLPMLYVTFSNIMCILGYQSPYILIQFGWLVSWAYLRFYKRTGGDIIGQGPATWGDRSETFAFVTWFPPLLHTPVSHLSDFVYNACTRVGLVVAYPSGGYEAVEGGYSLPGGARAEAERRRAMALKALDQRLASGHQSSNSGGGSSTPVNTKPPGAPGTSTNVSPDPSAAAGAAAAARAAAPTANGTA